MPQVVSRPLRIYRWASTWALATAIAAGTFILTLRACAVVSASCSMEAFIVRARAVLNLGSHR